MQWFIDFEFPNEDGEPYQSSGWEMIERELRLALKRWEVGALNNLGVVVGGRTPAKKVSGGVLKKIQIVVPAVWLIRIYIQIDKIISEMIITKEYEIENIKNLRDHLLQKLMSGEIRVH